MDTDCTVIDAAVRFLRTNPELVACARAGAEGTGLSVEELLAETVRRARSAAETVAEEEVVARTAG
ncbi:MAG: hypothetical protein JOZ46_11160 [Candidatus Dormibacteraeota bacterium]|nr:hypothetical protein [Candidatus Dormibacteraeota bacterium]MBV9526360.1 hypothetical protein [Candidatus Dormibacteraeota bacterium]